MKAKKMEKIYHISKGANDHYYILNHGSSFVKTLSTDLETAKIKAKKLIGYDIPVDIWHRKKSFGSDWKPQHDSHVDSYNQYMFLLKKQKIIDECNARQYVGEVGETLTKKLYLVDCHNAISSWGEFNIVIFEDSEKNRYIYFGNAKCFNGMQTVNSWNKDKVGRTFEFTIKKQYIHDKYLQNTALRTGKPKEIPYKINQICKPKITKEGNEWVY